MDPHSRRTILISDFNLSNLAALLSNTAGAAAMPATVAPFGQVYRTLRDAHLECWQTSYDLAVVWTRPQGVIEAFAALLRGEAADSERILSQVGEFAEAVLALQGRVGAVLIPSWVAAEYDAPTGMRALAGATGLSALLMRMNLRLAEKVGSQSNFYVLDTGRWIQAAGRSAFSPKLWYLAKIPFAQAVLAEAAASITAAADALTGRSRKLIVTDLDNTLWGGIVGDLGWEKLTLGGHDPAGEAYQDFQAALKSLKSRGILLAIVSKNDEDTALAAIDRHPEMILRRNDFLAWRINWEDKAANLVSLATELNLGLQSIVFLDDSAVERARVRETLPEVLVPELPEDKLLYRQTLMELRCFDQPTLSEEDLRRTDLYRGEQQRAQLLEQVGSFEHWLETLQTVVVVEDLKPVNLSRAVQLLNKTNQMNLTTRRLTESELLGWLDSPNRSLKTLRVTDKFGDSGLTGIISWVCDAGQLRIVDFVLSCRVMGRKVEETMLHLAVAATQNDNLRLMTLTYRKTEKNAPCLKFLQRSGLALAADGVTFTWECSADYPPPAGIRIERG